MSNWLLTVMTNVSVIFILPQRTGKDLTTVPMYNVTLCSRTTKLSCCSNNLRLNNRRSFDHLETSID